MKSSPSACKEINRRKELKCNAVHSTVQCRTCFLHSYLNLEAFLILLNIKQVTVPGIKTVLVTIILAHGL